MGSSANASPGGWQCIAVFEFDADAQVVDDLRGNAPDSCHLVIPARESPAGMRWYELYIDFGIGEAAALRLAQRQLAVIRQWADTGLLPGFRFVSCRDGLASDAPPARNDWRLRGVSGARDLN